MVETSNDGGLIYGLILTKQKWNSHGLGGTFEQTELNVISEYEFPTHNPIIQSERVTFGQVVLQKPADPYDQDVPYVGFTVRTNWRKPREN